MINRTTKLRWRRRLRTSRRQIEDIGFQAEEHLERHLFKRLNRLTDVLRFTSTWVGLLVLLTGLVVIQTRSLDNYYLNSEPAPGGTYVEGVLGSFTNANPIFATGAVNSSLAHLVFSGLLKFDVKDRLVSDLADTWSMDARGVTYTVHLRPNLKWQDGAPLTAADVAFTYQLIQNPDTQSPLETSWQGIQITTQGSQTIIFTLPSALTAFPDSLTTGIVPKHKLQNIPVAQLRAANFNTVNPIGSGPFAWFALQVTGQTPETREEQIELTPNTYYYGDPAKLSKFIVRSFHNQASLANSFKHQQLNGAAGLSQVPDGLQKDPSVHQYDIPLQSETMVFLKNTSPVLGDTKVRQALTMATDTSRVVTGLGYPVTLAREPILRSLAGYDPTLNQLAYNPAAANQLLDSAGWPVSSTGIRSKNNKLLTFTMYSPDDPDYVKVAHELQKQWRAAGIQVRLFLESPTDLQPIVSAHDYDALLYGISIGADPDVYAYWASSQADVRSPTRLNLSEYKSEAADTALQAGRTRTDPTLRAVKYKPFLETWRNDAPAIGLYQPRFLYLTRGRVFGFDPAIMNVDTDRYTNVNDWMIREVKTPK